MCDSLICALTNPKHREYVKKIESKKKNKNCTTDDNRMKDLKTLINFLVIHNQFDEGPGKNWRETNIPDLTKDETREFLIYLQENHKELGLHSSYRALKVLYTLHVSITKILPKLTECIKILATVQTPSNNGASCIELSEEMIASAFQNAYNSFNQNGDYINIAKQLGETLGSKHVIVAILNNQYEFIPFRDPKNKGRFKYPKMISQDQKAYNYSLLIHNPRREQQQTLLIRTLPLEYDEFGDFYAY